MSLCKKWYLVPFLILTFLGCALGRMQRYPSTGALEEKEISVAKPSSELRVGEKLVYKVRWLGIPVGTVKLLVREKGLFFEGKEVYHLTAEIESNAFLSRFYRINDFYQSYWDAQNRFSHRFEKKVSQGRYYADEIVTFYPEQKKGIYYAPEKNETKEFEIPGPVQDILSAIYYFRTTPYQTDLEFVFSLVTDEKNWQVALKTLEEGMLEVWRQGVHEAFLVEPETVRIDSAQDGTGEPYRPKANLWIWFSADEERIPLILIAEIGKFGIGNVTATLESKE